MANYNKVILVGNLTRDPQLSYLPNTQTAAVDLGLAVNRRWRGQDGQQREETTFVDCRAYGSQAETLNQYMRRGNPILIEGRLHLDQWQSQDGQKRSKLRVIIERFQFLGGPAGAGGGGQPAGQPRQAQQPRPAAQQAPAQNRPAEPDYPQEYPPGNDDPGEDIPF